MTREYKNPTPRLKEVEFISSTVSNKKTLFKSDSLSPEKAVEIFGTVILEPVVFNLCEQYLALFRLTSQVKELKRIIPSLPVTTDSISLRGLYETILPRLHRDQQKCRRHIQYLGRCYDLLNGTALFTPKPIRRQIDVTALKEHTDIASIIGEDVALRPSGRTLKARCPFHNDRTPSFVVYPDEGRWWCFGAYNDGGDVINYIQRKRDCGFREALAELQRL